MKNTFYMERILSIVLFMLLKMIIKIYSCDYLERNKKLELLYFYKKQRYNPFGVAPNKQGLLYIFD